LVVSRSENTGWNPFAGVWNALGRFVNIRHGPGAIGRIATVVLTAVVILGFIGVAVAIRSTGPWLLLVVVVAIVVLPVIFMLRAFQYADRYPQFAAMDGAQITRLLMQDGAMKQVAGVPPIELAARPIENPALSEPQAPATLAAPAEGSANGEAPHV
jgi:hypothetical protein